jgi:hypothetical protein
MARRVRASSQIEERAEMSDTFEVGPIDYLMVEWQGTRPHGELAPHLVDLVDRGLVRILDLVFIAKDEDGTVEFMELDAVSGDVPELEVFVGAATGLLDEEDRADAANIVEPGSAAALIVYENAWAAPFATALRGTGGHVVATGRIPVEEIVAALDAAESE